MELGMKPNVYNKFVLGVKKETYIKVKKISMFIVISV